MTIAETEMVYDVDERPRSIRDGIIYSLQWLATMFYGIVWGYAIVGIALGFEGEALTAYMAAIVLVTGISTLLQALAGHRFAMVSGPNVIPSLAIASLAAIHGPEVATEVFAAQIVVGAGIAILAIAGVLNIIEKIWSPLILGSMVLMIGLAIAGQAIELVAADGLGWPLWAGLALALCGAVLSINGRGIWSTLSPLLIVAGGYLVFVLGGRIDWELVREPTAFVLPSLLPHGWAWPAPDILVIIALANVMAALNLYGNVTGYAEVARAEVNRSTTRRMFMIFGGAETAAPGFVGAPPTVAYGENLGILATTRVASRHFILFAAACFTLLAFIGPVVGFASAMPDPVAGAVLLGIASTAIGIGITIMTSTGNFGQREQTIAGFAIFLALGLSLLPQDVLETVPAALQVLLENPIVTVILIVIVFEQLLLRRSSSDAA